MANEGMHGIVKWFSRERGYGFIVKELADKDEYFVHFSYIKMNGYRKLKAGQRVTFKLVQTDKGAQAQEVAVTG